MPEFMNTLLQILEPLQHMSDKEDLENLKKLWQETTGTILDDETC